MQTKKVTTELSKIDRAVATVEFIMKKRRRQVSEMEKRVGINENQRIFMGEELEWMKNVQTLIDRCKANLNMSLGKLPPQATDLEEAVLGAIILESGTPIKGEKRIDNSDVVKKVYSFLKVDHFYTEPHKMIYEACATLNFQNKPVDMRTVVVFLRNMGRLELIGGAHYIAELTSKVSSAANIEYHARVIIEQAINRQMILMAGTVLNDAYDNKDCFEILEFAEEQIKGVKEWIK